MRSEEIMREGLEKIEELANRYGDIRLYTIARDTLRAIDALAPAQPEMEEPVAWVYLDSDGEETLTRQPPDRVTSPEGYKITPLYAATPATATGELVALKEEIRSNITAASAMLALPYGLNLGQFCEAVTEMFAFWNTRPIEQREALQRIWHKCRESLDSQSRDRYDWIEDLEAIHEIATKALNPSVAAKAKAA